MTAVSSPTAPVAPHALYVAWGFPPMKGGGAYRTLATANVLVAAGFRVTVLTADKAGYLGFTGIDTGTEQLVDPRITMRRIPFVRPAQDVDIRTWPRERAADPNGWLEHFRQHELDVFPEAMFGIWHDPLLEAAEEIHQADPVDLVIGSANPHVDLAVGHHLNQRFGVPHVIDHRDAWRLSVYDGTEQGTEDPRIAQTETAYMASALEAWFVNEPIREWHQQVYPDAAAKMHVVENGFDSAATPAAHLEGPAPDEPLTFTFLGTIGPRVPIPELVDGWAHARERSAEIKSARAEIWGPLTEPRSPAGLILAGAKEFGVHYHGPVSKLDTPDVYTEASVLLLALGAGRYVTSGKVYEYMATGLPIVSIHEPGNGASEVLRDYPFWFRVTDLSPHAVAGALQAGAECARGAGPEQRAAAAAFGARYERSNQLRPAVERLRIKVTNEGEDR